jgi:iron complex outermembrane recepter protein
MRCFIRAKSPLPFTLSTLAAALLATSTYAADAPISTELETMTVTAQAQENAKQPARGYVAKRSSAGTKTDTPLAETPQSISVITAERIKDQNAQTLSETLRYSAGVTAETYGVDNRGDWISVRGTTAAIFLDGLREPLTGYWGSVRAEPYGFERVELIRGPSSVMYGQNTPGGLVNMVSKQPQAETKREISLQYGSYDYKQLAMDFTGAANSDDSVLYRLVMVGKDSNTQVDHAEDQRIYIAPSVTLLPGDDTSLTLYAQYQKDESSNTNAFLPWIGTLLPAPNGPIADSLFIGEPAWDTYGGERKRAGYTLEHQLDTAWTLRHHLRYDDVQGHMTSAYAAWWLGFKNASGVSDPNGQYLSRIGYVYAPTSKIANTDVQLEGKLRLGNTQHTVFLGVDGMWLDSTNPSSSLALTDLNVYHPVYGTAPAPSTSFSHVTTDNNTQVGVSLQDQMKLENWVVIAGARYDSARSKSRGVANSEKDESAISGKLGVVYLANNGISPYFSYSESFEPVAGTNAYGAAYEPKRGEQLEAGVKWLPAESRVSVTAAVYKLTENNRLTTDPNNPNNQIQAGETTTNGVELEATATAGSWEFIGSYSYTAAEITESKTPNDAALNKQFESIPKQQASAWAKNSFSIAGIPGFSAGAGARYLGKNWGEGEVISVPANMLVDALLSYTQKDWSFALNANNLLDKEYIATCLGRGDCWFGTRRRIVGTLTYNF